MLKPLIFSLLAVLAGVAAPSASAVDIGDLAWEAPDAAIRRQLTADPAVSTVRDGAGHLSFRGGTLAGHAVRTWRFTLPASGLPPQAAIQFAGLDAAFADFYRRLVAIHGQPDEFENDTRHDALWTTGPSVLSPGQTGNVLLTTVGAGADQKVDLTFFDTPTPPADIPRSTLRYTLRRDPAPAPAQVDAYRRIADAMDRAVRFYDRFTAGVTKTDTVFLDPGEATAEGNINGNIQFGPTDISLRTALHEMSHTVGIGTTRPYHRLTVDGQFVGKHALAQLRAITGDDHAVLHADTWHFWPYGLNNPGEDHSIWDYVHHCQMVSAILQDCREVR